MTTESSSVRVPRRKESNRPEEPYALICGPSLGRERVRRRVHPLPTSARIKNRPSWTCASKYPSRALSLLIFLVAPGFAPTTSPVVDLPPQPGIIRLRLTEIVHAGPWTTALRESHGRQPCQRHARSGDR